jgi:hypothetical protein
VLQRLEWLLYVSVDEIVTLRIDELTRLTAVRAIGGEPQPSQSIVRAKLSEVHCALIQLSDPVSLTDTSVMVSRRGFPSNVPR